VRHVTDSERRARLARRHALAPAYRLDSALAVTRAMTVLHATEAATVHLAVFARAEGLTVADVDRALYDERSLVKQLAMRRTLFVFPRDLLPAALGSASARVAGPHRARLIKDIEISGVATNGAAWLDRVSADVLACLADGLERSQRELGEVVPELRHKIDLAPGTKWGRAFPAGTRLLTQLGVEGRIVRASNAGRWSVARPRWTLTDRWLGEQPEPATEQDGYAELVRRWLRTFGPGTEADLVWWLGSTKSAVRRALADVGAVRVALDGGATGWLLPDDVDPVPGIAPWAALLPTLDPTVMGWKERAFYLGEHAPLLFDSVGNAGTTAWWDGRIVGCWVQDPDGGVVVELLEDVGADGRAALDTEAQRLTEWLDGLTVLGAYASSAMRAGRGRR
jgi:hypothetical protein